MALMYTYTTESIAGELASNRYGTLEAIRGRFGDKVDIADAPPVEVESKDFCPYWPGFARQGFNPYQ
jgi:hypothetical protein